MLVMVGFGWTDPEDALQLVLEPTLPLLPGRALGLLRAWDVRDRYARPRLVPPRLAKGQWCPYKDGPPSSLSLGFESEVHV
jgi:hypothetical protein